MVDFLTFLYLFEHWFFIGIFFILIGALFRNFITKRTVGTMFLLITYLALAISKISSAIYYTLQLFYPQEKFVDAFYLFGSAFVLTAMMFFYNFGSRHMLRDNDLLKISHTYLISVIFSFYLTITFTDLFLEFTGTFQAISVGEGGGTIYTMISGRLYTITTEFYLSGIILFVNFYVFLRIVIRSLFLARRTDKIVRRRGLQMIGYGVLIYLIGGLIGGLFYSIQNIPLEVSLVIYYVRSLFNLTAYFMMYIGWIMPDWFVRRVRGKSWFEQKYSEFIKVAVEKGE